MATNRKPCKVCKHRNVDAINRKIRNKESIASLARQYKIDRTTLSKHKKQCLAPVKDESLVIPGSTGMITAEEMLKIVAADMVMVHKMILSCDKYLTDPDNQDEYYLGPRGNEVDVVYNVIDEDGKVNNQQKKAPLQSLLDAVEASNRFIVMNLTSSHSDPRDLLLKSAEKYQKSANMIMEAMQKLIEYEFKNKTMDKLNKEDGVSLTVEQQVQTITKMVIKATKNADTDNLSELAGLPEIN